MRIRQFILLVVMFAATRHAMAQSDDSNMISLEDFLVEVGNKADCFFTLEIADRGGVMITPGVKMAKTVYGLKTLESDLSLGAYGFVVQRDNKLPTVFHVIDKQLTIIPGYALDKQINVGYTGTPLGLVDNLSKLVEGLERKKSFMVGTDQISLDNSTKIDFPLQTASVRSLITDNIPLEHYSRVVWIAKTSFLPKLRTVVNHLGPRNSKSQQ